MDAHMNIAARQSHGRKQHSISRTRAGRRPNSSNCFHGRGGSPVRCRAHKRGGVLRLAIIAPRAA